MARILVVDGDAGQRELMLDALREDHTVIGETDGQAAFVRMHIAPVDLLVLDLLLPGMAGHELLDRLIEEDLLHSPVLVTTALNNWGVQRFLGEQRQRCYVLNKPFSRRDFQEAVKAALRSSELAHREVTPLRADRNTWPIRVARTRFSGEVRMRLGQVKLFASAWNVSTQGLAVRTRLPVDIGRRLDLELCVPGDEALAVRARVMWTERINGAWAIGMTFDELPDETRERIRDLVTDSISAARSGEADRTHVRVPVSGPVHLTPMTTNLQLTAECVDLSPGGLGVTVDERVEVGESLLLGMHLPDIPEELQPTARVRWAALDPVVEGWRAGLEFEGLPEVAASQIHAFVTAAL